MADQEASIQSIDNADNQLSVGLVKSPNANIFSYLLDPFKVADAIFCTNELNPDYLPLVGVRTRRLGEQYPYPDLQGYRAGNEVTVVAYMQGKDKNIPPPARVIAYMKPNLGLSETKNSVVFVVGNVALGISGAGYLGFSSNLSLTIDGVGFGTSYNGIELMNLDPAANPTNLRYIRSFVSMDFKQAITNGVGSFRWVSSHGSYEHESEGDQSNNKLNVTFANHIEQRVLPTSGFFPAVQNNSISQVREYIYAGDDVFLIKDTLKNSSTVAVTDVYHFSGFICEMNNVYTFAGAGGLLVADTFHVNVSQSFSYVKSQSTGICVGIVCKSPISHKVAQRNYAVLPIGGSVIVQEAFDSTIDIHNGPQTGAAEDRIYNTVIYKTPKIEPSKIVELEHYLIFAPSEASIINKANQILGS